MRNFARRYGTSDPRSPAVIGMATGELVTIHETGGHDAETRGELIEECADCALSSTSACTEVREPIGTSIEWTCGEPQLR